MKPILIQKKIKIKPEIKNRIILNPRKKNKNNRHLNTSK
jgi:hypothetical protein